MSGDVIEAMAKALAQTLANESGHVDPYGRGYSERTRKVTGEHLRKAHALTLTALSVARDELRSDDMREAVGDALYANDGNSGTQRTTAALSAIAAHFGGAK